MIIGKNEEEKELFIDPTCRVCGEPMNFDLIRDDELTKNGGVTITLKFQLFCPSGCNDSE